MGGAHRGGGGRGGTVREHWALEFVGGPLDGRRDIAVSVDFSMFIYQSCAPIPVMTPASEVPIQSELFNHRYHLGKWRSRQGNWRVAQDIWLYEGLGK